MNILSSPDVSSAVILARGLGTRMRKPDSEAAVESAQAAVADSGVKGMIPIGRPFLDYVISALADAGYSRACLVIGPEHEAIREHYTVASPPRRVTLQFAVQEKPLGTADAVLAAEEFAAGEPFIVLNSDNYYPLAALRALRVTRPPALIAFSVRALIEIGNVSPDRARRFGSLNIGEDGMLRRIVAIGAADAAFDEEPYASMNCWSFTPAIFEACRRVPVSARGEFELPQAVALGIRELGMRFTAVRMREAVLDLSTRADIAEVQQRLRDTFVEI
ncbi:MAG: nucleotidyltransferase family protein [Gemmatimonadaceae bacterium]|nr:nucleotidyltransferase family protein [Gemmatimonadaceae bacterium]